MSVTPKTTTTATRTTRPTTGTAANRQAARTTATRKTAPSVVRPFQMPFEGKNMVLIVAGVGIIALGYLIMWMSPTMSEMALTVSPIVLLIGYCIVIPMGILAGTKSFRKVSSPGADEATNAMLS